jgi:tRNA threonylcarbamoyladenosine biosynthesis protein TsaE
MQPGVEHLGLLSAAPWQTRLFGVEMGRELLAGDLILLDGPFGAGKTTFVQGLAAGAGSSQRVTSPSFILINEYRGRLPIFHVDLFRLGELDLEMEQALESCEQGDGVTVIEWPQLLPADLREGALLIDMQVLEDEERSLVLHAEGSRWSPETLATVIEIALRAHEDGDR